jgi:Tfp pilus assembly protein FimV
MELSNTLSKSQVRTPIIPTEKEERFITYCRELGFGKFEVWVKEGQPVRAELPLKSIEF